MKKITMIFIVAAGLFSFTNISAQVRINANINIGSQPLWGPAGYDHVDYYYLPDIDAYYNVPEQVYYFNNGNKWKRSASLPARYKNFDVYRAHKVVINNVDRPYLQDNKYKKQYAGYKGRYDQTPIRDSRDERYFVNKNHPQHEQWEKNQHNDGRSNEERRNDGRKNDGRRG